MESYKLLVDILWEVSNLINSSNTNITWSRFNTVEEVLSTLDTYIKRLNQLDNAVISEIELLFAPTGSIQEISICSGWSNEYKKLSSRFDVIIASN
ncbi:hypothetical protein GC102_28995 [Paenibacillus sp. LMG 31460]|uniref:Uncharacterized protein n=1 Tax=Paenibacillus germinis TaxID=2654979 RepID=A0ABX1Z8S8_9BACL|nr:hypothetical protein [Paenibacillus germinis]NOU89758.1 hypothetical protein [Paenibacillus germinis]